MRDTTRRDSTVDVCIVGAGPAGAVTALSLGASGRSVVLLESGGPSPSPAAQELNEGEHVGESYAGLVSTRHRQIGGTANIWNVAVQGEPAAKYVPLSPTDITDWPISWKDLEPWYREAQTWCGIGPFEYGAERWATAARRPFQLQGTGLTSGVYQFGTAKRFTHDVWSPLRATEAVTLVPETTAVDLLVDRSATRLLGVQARTATGETLEVKARVVVLACGAVENARLMLLTGLGEGRWWLGRGFMEHARDFSSVLVPNSPQLFADASFYDLHSSADGFWIGGRITLTADALDSYELPNASMTLVPRARAGRSQSFPARALRRIKRAAGVTEPGRYGWSAVRAPARVFDVFNTVLNFEHDPNPSNRIELGSRHDRFGNRLPRLVLGWTEREQERLERFRGLLDLWFRSAGLGRLHITKGQRPDLNAHHHAGTTRMGLDPDDGVVDAQARVFGIDNLYLAGASVFPTGGFANPTLTIVAMALRLAKHLDGALGTR